jgi:hypothetical protein
LFESDAHEFGRRNSNFFPVEPALQLPRHVHVVILDDPQNNIRGADALSALRRLKLASLLDLVVDVFAASRSIGRVIVRHIVDVVLL